MLNHTWMYRTLALAMSAALYVGCSTPPRATLKYSMPELPADVPGYQDKPGWATHQFAVAAANPLATDAGYQVLLAGGSAIDAAVAVQMVLALVEPQSSGIGGGSFILHYDGRAVQAYDGRETAPSQATENLFLDAQGKPMAFQDAVVGGRAVGTPGTLSVLEAAQRVHGVLPWAQLMEPAIALAERGFKVSPRLHEQIKADAFLPKDPVAAAYFYDAQGQAWPVGHVLRNPEFAAVLRQVALQGAKALKEGPIAQAIVDKVRQHPGNPGLLSLADLAGYQVRTREPLCFDHHVSPPAVPARDYRLCGFPPPSSGAIAIGQILGILNHTPAAGIALQDG
ncbi:MAG: gamma-glutamyltransferase, partial [Rhodoferax sp.]